MTFTFRDRPKLIYIVCVLELIQLFGLSLLGMLYSIIFHQSLTIGVFIVGLLNLLFYAITLIGIFKMLKLGVYGYTILTLANIVLGTLVGKPPAIYSYHTNIPVIAIGLWYLKQMK